MKNAGTFFGFLHYYYNREKAAKNAYLKGEKSPLRNVMRDRAKRWRRQCEKQKCMEICGKNGKKRVIYKMFTITKTAKADLFCVGFALKKRCFRGVKHLDFPSLFFAKKRALSALAAFT